MAKELNKQVDYRGFKVNIKIDLDYSDKGKNKVTNDSTTRYEVIVNDMGQGSYYKRYVVKHNTLEDELAEIEELTKKHFDDLIMSSKSETENFLEKLGYK